MRTARDHNLLCPWPAPRIHLRGVLAFGLAFTLCVRPAPARAIPVVDLTNYVQNLLTALENVDQTIQAVRSYQTQLAEYEELLKSTAAVPVHTWDRIHSIKANLDGLLRDLRDYRGFLVDVGDYLEQLTDPDFYRSSQCYGPNVDCPGKVWAEVLRAHAEMSERVAAARMRTLDQLELAVNHSEDAMPAEADELRVLQQASKDTEGNLQAAQVGNELHAAEVRQLMELRSITHAQYRAWMTEQRARTAKEEARRRASLRYRAPVQLEADEPTKLGLDPWGDGT